MSADIRQLTVQSITPANSAIQAGDTLETALGKVQGQLNAIPLTPTAVKTSAYTAGAGELVKTDATSGNVPVALPTAPADKTRVAVKMIAVSGTNTTPVTTGGTDVFNKAGGSTSITLTLLNQGLIFQYEAATGIWSVTSGDIPLSQLDGRFAAQTVTKRAAQIFGTAGSRTDVTGTEVLIRLPWMPAVTTTRWRFRHNNKTAVSPANSGVLISCTGLYVGNIAYNTTGDRAGNTTAAPTQYLPAYSFDSTGGEYQSAWITDPTLQFTAGREVYISLGMTAPSSITFKGTSYICHRNLNAGAAALSSVASPGSMVSAGGAYTFVEIEFETTDRPTVGLFVGDSLTEALNTMSWAQIVAQEIGGVAVVNAKGGEFSSGYTSTSAYNWTRLPNLGTWDIDYGFIFIGSNDASSSISLTSFQSNIISTIANIRTLTGKPNLPVYAATVMPKQLTSGSAQENLRISYNTWLRGNPAGLAGVFDFDRALRSPTDFTVLDADYLGTSDNTHPDQAGQVRLAQTVGGAVNRRK